MPQVNADASDFEKLQLAFQQITSKFGSIDDILHAFGLAELPTAQRYGILFGFIVFTLTVSTVLALLVFGGTFQRIAEQSETGKVGVESDFRVRLERPLLLERLLQARQWLLQQNYPNRPQRNDKTTNLTTMLSSVPPPKDDQAASNSSDNEKFNFSNQRADIMVGYKQNYFMGYRKCQDQPGGAVLVGRPEARYEAFARAYAGCGDKTSLSYRRSYARLYESVSCESLSADDKYSTLYKNRPQDIIGKWIRLEPLDAKRHVNAVFAVTNGDPIFLKPAYDPQEVWGFQIQGPFRTPEELEKSFVFQHYDNEASFAILQNLNDRLVGVVSVSKDQPQNLSIQLDQPIVGPSSFGSKEQLEACYLMMDRLFAYGYRRIQISIDSKDNQGAKLADRLGFTYEGCLLKDQIVKESSRDSNVYGMLNSDWDKGARTALYRKLYGAAMAKADMAYNKKEAELDEQQRVRAEQERDLGNEDTSKDKKV
ncbi:GNAT family acetyltransferase [Nitzschia inconspicua]|uniref:GNAT family acetyltransferase n=1 Tax=Nitzschia inconspicua TaxID=303405 RepID=A0A9K3LP08_9STRA|nr:GNAT family acetyltransferase [Nitzschia inconspicua]